MSAREPLALDRALAMALTASLTVWVSMHAWRPLSVTSDHLTPLLFCALLLGLVSALTRWRGLATVWIVLLEIAISGLLLLWWGAGTLVPSGEDLRRVGEVFASAVESAGRYAVPVPTDVAPVTPLFFLVGLVSMVVVNLLAMSTRSVALTGLVLFVLQVVPVNLGANVGWFVFALVACGYLFLLFLTQDNVITRWGHEIADRGQRGALVTDATTGRMHAWQIGAVAVVGATLLSTVLSSLIPGTGTLFSPQTQSSRNEVMLTSPLVDLRRDLVRGADVPLLRVEGARKPSYVRTAVLASFNGREWSSGSRRATRVQKADGTELELSGISPFLDRDRTVYEFEATRAFRSRWLPVMPLSETVVAEGDWRYDFDTMDFAAFDNDLDTANLNWQVTGVEVDYDLEELDNATYRDGLISEQFLDLPDDLPPMVAELAEQVAGDESSKYRQARALQSWFRSEFSYSLEQADSVGNDELVAFLDESGRVGYCEQFAASMAVMARTLDIPSRVAVGFLQPRAVGEDRWEFSAHDLHAWPELYFAGSGWIRFEPTPPTRASGVPEHSEDGFEESEEAPVPGESQPTSAPSQAPSAPTPPPTTEPATEDGASPVGSGWLLGAGLGVLVVVALFTSMATLPHWVRRRRRRHRVESVEVEELWSELRDTATDLGLLWPQGRSPQAVGDQVKRWVRPDPGTGTGVESELDAEARADAEAQADAAVQRLVHAVEVNRFGPSARAATPDLIEDLATCVAALEKASSTRKLRRAHWLPRSVFVEPGPRKRA